MEFYEEFEYDDAVLNMSSLGINIHNITHDDMLNGDGLRVVLWVAGCSHCCEGCQNPCTWNPYSGIPFTEWEKAELYEWLSKSWTQGITFSGGDPLHPNNREYVGNLMKDIKEKYPSKDIWLYTGYELTSEEGNFFFADGDDVFQYPYLELIDVLCDGKFECETRKNDIAEQRKVLWVGSSNQRVIDVKKSLLENRIVTR